MSVIRVTFSPAEGILLRGTGREHAPAIKAARGWKWSSRETFWYRPRTRDTVQSKGRVELLASDLRRELDRSHLHGETIVEVSYELGEVRPAAEIEADKRERAEARAERLDEKADRLAREAGARHDAATRTADMIPLGQPILVGHHSEKRHRRDVERIRTNFEKAAELSSEAKDVRAAAARAETVAEGKVNPGRVRRRIDTLEADRRQIDRELDGRPEVRGLDELRATGLCSTRGCGAGWIIPGGEKGPPLCREHAVAAGRGDEEDKTGVFACPVGPSCLDPLCIAENERRGVLKAAGKGANYPWSSSPIVQVLEFPGPQRKAELLARKAAIVDEIGHLRSKLGAFDLAGPANFSKGQRVEYGGGAVVERVNPKSVTLRLDHPPGGSEAFRVVKVPYDRMKARPKA